MQVQIDSNDSTRSIRHISIQQSMTSHHTFELRQSLDDRADAFIDILKTKSNEILGKKVEIKFGESNKFIGIITDISLGRSAGSSNELIIRGKSPTISMDEGAHTTSFYDKTLKEIVGNTLNHYSGFATENKTKYSKKLKYIVQYREGNFIFLSRLAARFGEWMFYDGNKLYFGQKPAAGTPIELSFGVDLRAMDLNMKVIPINLELLAYDYKKHDYLKKKTEYNNLNEYAQIAHDKSKNDVFTGNAVAPFPQYMSESDLEDFAKIHSQARVSEMVFLSGSTTNAELKIGTIIHVQDSRPDLLGGADDYGTYIITQLHHTFSLHGQRFDYYCQFEAIPEETETPPITNPIAPPYAEMQLADVTENNDPDGMGRIRVQFIWQRELGEKSPWIRVASPYSGKNKGFYIIPEKGDQVLVAFESNNPERPFALTGMYNSDAKPEHHHSENNKKAIKTAGGHEIMMNDEKGKEAFGITSPTDVSIVAKGGKMTISANGDISVTSSSGNISIKSPGTISLSGKDIALHADNEIKMEAITISAKSSADVTIKSKKIAVEADVTASVKATTALSLEGQASVSINSSGITTVAGSIIKLN